MGQRLLVLDADSAFIDEHGTALELVFDVDFVGSSENVVKILEGGNYAAILISVEIDDGRGYAVCASIRNHRPLSGFKIVLISSNATKSEFARHRKLRVHADHYMHKPIQTNALISELSAFVPKKAAALDGTLDVLMGVDLDEDWLASLESVASADAAPKNDKPRSWEDDHAAGMGRLITELRAKTLELAHARQEIEEQQNGMAAMSAELDEAKAELHAKTLDLLGARQDVQELQRKNDTITVNLEELEERQKDLEGLQVRLRETEGQLKYLESPSRLGKYADGILYERMCEAVAEKRELLLRLEALTQEAAEKDLRAVALMRARESAQQHFLEIEGRVRQVERDFESRVESERMLLFARMEEMKDAEAAARKQARALEETCADLGRDLKTAALAHEEEKRRLAEDFERQKQGLVSLLRARNERQAAAPSTPSAPGTADAATAATGDFAKLPAGAGEGGS